MKQQYKKVLMAVVLFASICLITGCSIDNKKVHNNPKIMVPKVQKIYMYMIRAIF